MANDSNSLPPRTDNSKTTFALIVPITGIIGTADATYSPNAGDAILNNVCLSCPMLLDKLGFIVAGSGTGVIQWGLFDFSQSPTSAKKVAGGSGALNATGYQTIAADNSPVFIPPGDYALLTLYPSSSASLRRTTDDSFYAIPFQKFKTSYTWTDTPDITTGWTVNNVTGNNYLHGRLPNNATW